MQFQKEKFRPQRRSWAIALGIILPAFVSITLFGLLVFALLLPTYRTTIINQKKDNVRQMTEAAWGVLKACGQMEESGLMTPWEAREKATQIVGAMRYGTEGMDYFWIHDLTPKMVCHPYRPDLIGEDISSITDPDGKPMFQEMVQQAKNSGSGYVEYIWQYKNNPQSYSAKMSFVKLYEPWGWVVGTGMYLDEAHTEISRVTENLIGWSLAILGIAILLMYSAVRRSIAAERQRITTESALEETGERYRILAENMTDVVWALDLKTRRMAYVSPSIELLLGYSAEEVMEAPPFSFMVLESRHKAIETLTQALDRARENPGASITETIIVEDLHKNGSKVSVEINAALIYGDNEEPHLAVGTSRNVTARTRAEKALRASEERFRAMTENSADITIVVSHDLNIVYASPSVKWSGWTPDEVISQGYKGFIHPDDVPELARAVSKASRTPAKPVRISSLRIKRKDSSYAFFEGLMTCLLGTPGVDGFLFNGMDVTERKMAEEALELNELLYRGLFENSGAATFVFGDSGVVSMCNSEFTHLIGNTRQEIVNKMHWSSFFHPEELPRLQDYHRRRSQGLPAPKAYEVRVITKDGDIKHMYNRVVVIEGTKERISSLLDITDLVKTRQEKEKLETSLRQSHKMEAIGTLAGGIAHDFNNILFPILGFTEMAIEQTPEDDPNRDNLDEILKATLRAKALVSQILTFSRQTTESLKPVRLRPIVEDVLSLLRATLPAFITIRQHLDKDCGIVFADPNQIHQVVMNLCTNAYQSMREKGGVLRVTMRQVYMPADDARNSLKRLATGEYVRLGVSDSGHGMPPEVMERIFEPYFTTKKVGEGTGMGLAIAHGIIRKHGGDILVQSQVGKGSRFDVYIPVASNGDAEAKDSETGPVPTGSGRILLVDDEVQILEMTYQMLKKLGYDVTALVSSTEALTLFREEPRAFDLVLTDMTMPDMTGDLFAQEILLIRPDTPVIMCTGFSERISKERAQEIGISEYILKPVVMKHLAQAVNRALEKNSRKE